MASKAVTFNLQGNAQGFNRAAKSASGSAQKLDKSIRATGNGAIRFATKLKNLGSTALTLSKKFLTLQTNMLGIQTVIKGFRGLSTAVKAFASFEEGLLAIQAVSGATAKEMVDLRGLIEKLTISTKFSAEQVNQAAFNLASLGIKGQKAFEQLLPIVTDLAIGLGVEAPRAAEVLLSTMRQFKVPMGEASRVADVLANAYSKTSLNLDKFALAFQFIGPVAAAFGVSMEEAAALTALVTDAGIDASTAGTQLRSIMAALSSPTGKASAVLKKYGLTAADVSLENQGLVDVLEKLKTANVTTAEFTDLFGKRALAITATLLGETAAGEKNISVLRRMTREMGEAGTSARITATMQQGLGFAFAQSAASFNLFLVSTGEALNDIFDLQGKATKLADIFADLTKIVKNLDFGVLQTAGVKIFDPTEIAKNLETAFLVVLPTAINLFKGAMAFAGLFMLETIAKNFPGTVAFFGTVFAPAFITIMAEGAKLFVTVFTEGFVFAVAMGVNLLSKAVSGVAEVFSEIFSFIPGQGALSTLLGALAEKPTDDFGSIKKSIEEFISKDEVQENAKTAIDLAQKNLKEELIGGVQDFVNAIRPEFEDFAKSLRAEREEIGASLGGKKDIFFEALKQVPTEKQRDAFGNVTSEVSRALNFQAEEQTARFGATTDKFSQAGNLDGQILKAGFEFEDERFFTSLRAEEADTENSRRQTLLEAAKALGGNKPPKKQVQSEETVEVQGTSRLHQNLGEIESISDVRIDNSINNFFREPNRLQQIVDDGTKRNPRGDRN